MDTGYSPHDSHAAAAAPDTSRRQERSPPLVPLPAQAGGYHHEEREAEVQRGSYAGGAERASYPGDAYGRPPAGQPSVAAYYVRPPEDPYRRYPPAPSPYDYPPRADYYSASAAPPPPPADYYRQPAPPAPYRDPYSYPPRGPYEQSYPPRQASYPAYPPHTPSRDLYPGRDHYTPSTSSSYPPRDALPPRTESLDASKPYDLGPHPDPNALSIPLLYLARVISLKTFTALQPKFANLDLRFVYSLLDLSSELHAASTEPPDSLGDKRRVWITAVGGTDSLVARVKSNTPEVLDWREVDDLQELERELAEEDRRVALAREKGGKEADDERERSRTLDDEEVEREKGRREIEEFERKRRFGEAGGMRSEADELDEVLRAVRGESTGTSPASGAATSPSVLPWSDGAQMPPPPLQAIDFAAPVHQNSTARHASEDAHSTDRTDSQSPKRARKRSRHDSDTVHDDEHEKRRALRKKLEAVCKTPRRSCAAFAAEHGIPVNEETRLADDEPQLGERHRGNWDLFGQELDDVSPQIQVLMARAMRDITYSPRLRLYDHPEALEMLHAAVPWFTTLLDTIKDRYELAGAASVAPQDPPLGDTFAFLPESSTQVPTLASLALATGTDSVSAMATEAPPP
ncbi:hypothetical protein NBRC10512_001517 [Rhodotorula toruloides]|uniref:RHTO0S07e08328g1_1 n=2 Tax=Rhodotorula toruloides TaxID=5286 RepID=A0A061B637_RHOTO|nr:uncharacterized protein RHTO_03025 [Rhodotorula toruloides NP11]EMS25297.1 hypothetical protein RHTO_03025 [Rhodotorula toruloides NP11]KAJ8295493.1 hypothetical protein OF846_001716 [Rhodotorula toruloides]CDR43102.1 RHTO0S07e08328g1_1 [Rhodotorula toruloides]